MKQTAINGTFLIQAIKSGSPLRDPLFLLLGGKMNKETLEKAKEIFQKTCDEMSLQLVSVKYITSGSDGPVLEVLIDHDFNITMDEIEQFTEKVNPLLDEIDDSEDGYMLDISSGGSERTISFYDLSFLIGKWLDVTLVESGETVLVQLDSIENDVALFHNFIKGRKKKYELKADMIKVIHMGYKA